MKKRQLKIKECLLLMFISLSMSTIKGSEDPDLADFEIVDSSAISNPSMQPMQQKRSLEDVKRMMAQTENKINVARNFIKSDELSGMAKALAKMKNSIHKRLFKQGPGFEIQNKAEYPIWVAVVKNNILSKFGKNNGRYLINAGDVLALDLADLTADLKIAIYLQDPELVSYSSKQDAFSVDPNFLYETTEGAQGKTKYLTWNPEKFNQPTKYLYPQTGRLAGAVKVSDSKYSLRNNIKSFELGLTQINIEEQSEQEAEEAEMQE